MRWATFVDGRTGQDRVGLVVGDRLHALEPGVALLDLLGDDGERLAEAGERAERDPVDVVDLGTVRLRAPIPRPPTVRDFYAFEEHARTARRGRGLDMDPDWYKLPVFYFSNPYAVSGPGDEGPVPPGSKALDYELEVAAIVGRGGADLDPGEAESHVAGFCVMNDWSARDLQRREMKLSLGPAKGKDSATTLGPFLVTPDELEPHRKGRAYDLAMTATVNGVEYSRGNLSDVYWSFGEMLAYASRGTRVEPGDVIGSGTCGTGCILELSLVHGAEAYPWLRPGDEVALTVERLGTIANRVVRGRPATPLRETG
ncbi:MAG: fumarylacetoacetate hydrolase family protein [Actinobacteria bacterium]|nr:fumarylacetoacetate hydrolase family protein [Actinomycetota bacterium]